MMSNSDRASRVAKNHQQRLHKCSRQHLVVMKRATSQVLEVMSGGNEEHQFDAERRWLLSMSTPTAQLHLL